MLQPNLPSNLYTAVAALAITILTFLPAYEFKENRDLRVARERYETDKIKSQDKWERLENADPRLQAVRLKLAQAADKYTDAVDMIEEDNLQEEEGKLSREFESFKEEQEKIRKAIIAENPDLLETQREIEGKQRELQVMTDTLNELRIYKYVGMVCGVILLIGAFLGWYFKVQKPADALIAAEVMKLRSQSTEQEASNESSTK